MEYCLLEGFVYVVSLFNFMVIVGNLLGLLVLLGNVVVWKLSDYVIVSNWLFYNILVEVGLFREVI